MSQNPLKLLLVEDHMALREVLTESLLAFGYDVLAFESAEDALEDESVFSCSIALLDLNLPGEDGLYLTEQLRMKNPIIGVVMLTVRTEVKDKLEGYQVGADFYLPKPVSPEELHAAIQALCRRLPHLMQVEITLNSTTHQLSNSKMDTILLSPEDSRLLTVLSLAPNKQLEFWELAERLSLDLDSQTLRSTLEKRISRLRQKLIRIHQPATSIMAVRGVGYKLTISVSIQ
ncbi:DNA-binding response regulator [Thiomicrorhabdus immobilis]|uniref:DNA-binding response regulator n=1 Tax=Thiomicrorhabdus immobilis TaxID=2791037 RepID=A0ABM7MFD8_9GAMM|nr:response regulator transcription factor [Thiomicrorhabdus immobilis]BCN94146.1 DNA-binding response regulator [Thiomicrorhabdus immobilis]